MSRRLPAFAALVAVLLTGCRALAPGASGNAQDLPTDPSAVVVPTASAGAAETASTPTECPLGIGIAEVQYTGLRELARFSDGVAVAEVVSVGDMQYTTESGERPSCDYIAAAQSPFAIGRRVQLRVETPVAGAARAGQELQYLFPGGTLGRDVSPGHHFGLETPKPGDRMLVLLTETPIDADPGTGELRVDVLEMFAIGGGGRIATPDASERLTVDRLPEILREVLPPASPGS